MILFEKIDIKNFFYDFKVDTHCYKVISHPSTATINSSLIVSAHEDKKIRFFDINSGKLVYQMVAHQDACTDLAIDPTCFYLISASKSICLIEIFTKNIYQISNKKIFINKRSRLFDPPLELG